MTERKKADKSLGQRVTDRVRDLVDELLDALGEAFSPTPERSVSKSGE